ncbi:MAG: DinB family protein [Gemmatimonadaceae bacterium]
MIPPACARSLLSVVAANEPRLLAIGAIESRARTRPDGWSRRELIGHLIDSASINNQRFVRSQVQDDLVFHSYDQDLWVASQKYHDAEWVELVQLWALHNRQIARVMSSIPERVRLREHRRHNFDRIAFHIVPAEDPSSLGYLMDDYVLHLKHHLAAIFRLGWNE